MRVEHMQVCEIKNCSCLHTCLLPCLTNAVSPPLRKDTQTIAKKKKILRRVICQYYAAVSVNSTRIIVYGIIV
jgi:hypothetical protein